MHPPSVNSPLGALAGRMDILSFNRLHLSMLLLLGFAMLTAQMAAQMSTVLTAVFSDPASGVSREQFTAMLVTYYVAAAIGAPAMGALADRFGRRVAVMSVLACFGALSIASSLMAGFTEFAVFRVLSSFAISATPALALSYIADTLPARIRGSLMMLTAISGGIGAAMAPLVTSWANGTMPFGLPGWQATLAIAGTGGIGVAALCWLLPESPRWLLTRDRHEQAESIVTRFEKSAVPRKRVAEPAVAPAAAVTSGDAAPAPTTSSPAAGLGHYRRRLAMVLTVFLLQSCGGAGFAVLIAKAFMMRGMSMQAALQQTALVMLALPVGVVATSFIVDRVPRRALYIGIAMIAGFAAIVLGATSSPVVMVAAATLFALTSSAHNSVGQVYCAELFPTHLRSTAMGAGYGALRAGSALVPLLLLPLLLDHGPTAAFSVIGGCILGAGLVVGLFGPVIRPGVQLG